jgi:beta-aspartyl-peptidase (threonine type)
MLTLLTATCLALADGEQPQKAGPADAIRKVLDDQATAWNKGDLEGFMAGYWKSDKLTFFSGKDKTQGWQATLDRYRKRYQADGKEMGKLTFSDLQIEILGPDSAFVRGRYRLVLGKETPQGIFTLIFKKTADGWRIVHDHTSGA